MYLGVEILKQTIFSGLLISNVWRVLILAISKKINRFIKIKIKFIKNYCCSDIVLKGSAGGNEVVPVSSPAIPAFFPPFKAMSHWKY